MTSRAEIVDIKRFAVHDGDGIRTTVFFKGCPLKCVWCHNPESISPRAQLAYYSHKCIGCGACADVCPNDAHKFENGRHIFTKDLCTACGKCTEACRGDALKLYGRTYTPDELLPILLEDKDFYDESGGGVTLSGGECLIQADFCAELLMALKDRGIDTAVDTCGFVSRESLDKVIPYTDTFLYDIKAFDNDVHVRCTGRSNELILENLGYIDSKNKSIEVRIPYVPSFNDDQIEKIAELLSTVKNLKKVRVLAYHDLAASKYSALGMKNTLPKGLPTGDMIKEAERIIEQRLKK